ncbi:MAG: ABC transporter ATP-binding protein [Candidatus Ozemobacteraceae bacterium]
MAQNNCVIEIQNVSKNYGDRKVLDGISIEIPRGEIFGLLGNNGAGKTTLIHLVLGLLQPSAGHVHLFSSSIQDRNVRAKIGYLPELQNLYEFLSAREFLTFHAQLYGLTGWALEKQVKETLETIGLMDRADERVAKYSKGMKQRLALGQAIIGTPELLFLDEPASGLDPSGQRDIKEIIGTLHRKGVTIFLNSHMLTDVERICGRVAILSHGILAKCGRVDEITAGGSMFLEVTFFEGDAHAVLPTIPGIKSIQWEGPRAILKMETQEALSQILGIILEKGLKIGTLNTRHETLSDVFEEVTQNVQPH